MEGTMVESPEKAFYLFQVVLGVAAIGAAFYIFRGRTPESNFRVREADVRKPGPKTNPGEKKIDSLADARLKPKVPETIALPGIRIDALAHEILGIAANASPEEIQRAYRERMKRYHPDLVGPPGSREWKDAQRIAEAVIKAKDEMLKRQGQTAQAQAQAKSTKPASKPGSGQGKPS
jgi:hypothetical protein